VSTTNLAAPALRSAPTSRAGGSSDATRRLLEQVESVLRGKGEVVELALACLVAGGHLLLEDVPGVGKTTLGRALAASIGASFSRIQFTSDLLPSDILGVNIYDRSSGSFQFKAGPIFANVVLADEINRTTPRTQSCLLEAMSEARVTIDETTHPLPAPFLVIATQNPLEAHGTYPLPESQLDRFLMRVAIGYPGRDVERAILADRRRDEPVDRLDPVVATDDLKTMQADADGVRVDESVTDYVMSIVEATRQSARLAVGVSTRGALALMRAARALALVRGRSYVVPDDIRSLAGPVLSHRVSLGGDLAAWGGSRKAAEDLIAELVAGVEAPV
jgi:MoxR-like ATPase